MIVAPVKQKHMILNDTTKNTVSLIAL